MNTRKGILGLLLMALLPLSAQARGGSTLEAQQLSATALRGKITVQATLVAMRDITGTTIWLLVGTIAFVLFFPYHRDEYA